MSKILSFNNKLLANPSGSQLLGSVGLPPYTIRLLYRENTTPVRHQGSIVQVSESPNVWDLTYENRDWSSLLVQETNLIEVLEANTKGVTNMSYLFRDCSSLTTICHFNTSSVTNMQGMFYYCTALRGDIPLFDTRNVTDMSYMFYNCSYVEGIPTFNTSNVTNMREMLCWCSNLLEIPLFDTSNVQNMDYMCRYCSNVLRGMLRLYEQASTQTIVPAQHWGCFDQCGMRLQEERALIPYSWGGDGQG